MTKILFSIITSLIFLSCDEEYSNEQFNMATGTIVKLSADNYGIDGESKVVGRFLSPTKRVKYRLVWLPQEVKNYIEKAPEAVYKYYYRVIAQGGDLDWSTTIEIITD
jgi:hypothetical protein